MISHHAGLGFGDVTDVEVVDDDHYCGGVEGVLGLEFEGGGCVELADVGGFSVLNYLY